MVGQGHALGPAQPSFRVVLRLVVRRAVLVSVFLGFRDRRFSIGAVAILAAFGYLRAVRWVDEHGGWP